jgi:uncharacterized protein YodC (DUF2158 family)
MTFRVGDTVKLKSGGPLMTVTNPGGQTGGKTVVSCTWFDGSEVKASVFPPDALEVATKPDYAKAASEVASKLAR